jgi:hypothetical protein
VSRILKENAVDCLLNIDQTKFSQEVIQRHNHGQNVTVRQVLADGTRLPSYAVGDRPFSFVCDYQARCEYQCAVGGRDKLQVNDYTYSQPFIAMNADRITQRIRDLFREEHFYARRLLLAHLSAHPREQVDVALTRLLHDDRERLVDKYGRSGRMINVGEYYLFQPSEITDPRIGVHDRSAPLQFKRDHISFPLNDGTLERLATKHGLKVLPKPGAQQPQQPHQQPQQPQQPQQRPQRPQQPQQPQQPQVPQQVESIRAEFDAIMQGGQLAAIDKNTKSWNELCADVVRELRDRFGLQADVVKKCVVHHFLDEFAVSASSAATFELQLQYLNALYAKSGPASEFDRLAREYFDGLVLANPKYAREEGILLLNSASQTGMQLVVRKNADSAWSVAKSSEEWRPYMEQIAGMVPKEAALAPIIGFVSEFKEKNGGSYAVFKIKYVSEKGTGARCDQISSKQRRLTIVNQIASGLDADAEPLYTMENTKNQNTSRYCVLSELLLRCFNAIKKDGRHWFLSPVQFKSQK